MFVVVGLDGICLCERCNLGGGGVDRCHIGGMFSR
jgi:hypothetical protein